MREVAHCYVVVAGRVLLLERAAGLRGAGFWAPPGGHLETGESPLEAVCRECAEELGLAPRPDASLDLGREAGGEAEVCGQSLARPEGVFDLHRGLPVGLFVQVLGQEWVEGDL